MKGKMNDRDAKCPFFCAHTKDSVICEGLIPDSRARISFENGAGKKTQYAVFCCWKFENCERYQALMKRYLEEQEEDEAMGGPVFRAAAAPAPWFGAGRNGAAREGGSFF